MDEKVLAKRLQAVRQSAGLTQQQLCHKANLSYSTLAKIERGAIKSPSIFTIQSIAAALGVTLDELIGGSEASASRRTLMTTKSGVKFVYFDVNGCLVRFYQRTFTKMAEETGAPADMIETAYWHYNDDVCRGNISMGDFNAALAERLQVKSIDWGKYYLDAIEPIESVRELLIEASHHYRVGLLTNIMPGLVEAMRQRNILPDINYDTIIDSSVVGAIKPEPKIYEIAEREAAVPPSEILLIDDARANLVAAEQQGWHVLWFDDYRMDESIDKIRNALTPTR